MRRPRLERGPQNRHGRWGIMWCREIVRDVGSGRTFEGGGMGRQVLSNIRARARAKKSGAPAPIWARAEGETIFYRARAFFCAV